MIWRFLPFFLFVIAFEFLACRAVLKFFSERDTRLKARKIYWIAVALLIGVAMSLYLFNLLNPNPDHVQFRKFFTITGLFLLNFVPKLILIIFSLVEDLLSFILFLSAKIYKKRLRFPTLGKFWLVASLIISAIMFLQLVYGMIWGKSRFVVREIHIESERIPPAFDMFRIAHISDLHLGSFKNDKILQRGISLLLAQNPSLIVITGDIVNNEASELMAYKNVLAQLEAPYGVFTVLGNHDMGDYRRWYNEREKSCNLNQLIGFQEDLGWQVLLNSHQFITVSEDSMALIGVMNWGLPPFKSYGDLNAARGGINDSVFSILLSHDPSHWESEVLLHTPIDLTLSGHTHGFQYALGLGKFRVSPVQFKYKRWGGLYEENGQFLNVNTGFGYIGFAGRVGVPPEISLITLKSKR